MSISSPGCGAAASTWAAAWARTRRSCCTGGCPRCRFASPGTAPPRWRSPRRSRTTPRSNGSTTPGLPRIRSTSWRASSSTRDRKAGATAQSSPSRRAAGEQPGWRCATVSGWPGWPPAWVASTAWSATSPRPPTGSSTTRRSRQPASCPLPCGSASGWRTRTTSSATSRPRWTACRRARGARSQGRRRFPPATTASTVTGVTAVTYRRFAVAATLRARLVGSACAAVLATSALAVTPQAYADHGGGGPSAGQVAASKARVARLERKFAATADAVTRAQQSLDAARTAAEVAVEAYDKARVRQAASVHALGAAQLVLDAAGARVASARRGVSRFAAAAYEGGTLSSLDVVLNSKGPDAMLYRLSALDAVSRSQRDVLQTMDAAKVYQSAVQQQAAEVVAESTRATKAADAARVHAAQLVAAQTAAVARVSAASDHLSAMLADARAHASALERARLQALADARARALAAKRAAALRAAQDRANQQAQNGQGGQGAGSQQSGGQDFGATVSAATERDALAAAESQLGKPYEWGAAGPDTYDCSGLVMWAYAQVGVHVDHWTGDQWNEGAHIPVSALREGDLLFFATDTSDPNTIHHVGMYVGNGQMIEAPYTGANVRYSDAFRPDLIGAVRLYNR